MKHLLLSICFCLFIFNLNAQVGKSFNKRIEKQRKGELVLISNNILSKGNNANIPYDDVDKKAKQNDELKMKYIDIDQDATTFSSSSADFYLSNPEAKIVYAGVYWSATYKYEEGKLKSKVFTASNEDRFDFDEIKIKFPNTENYTSISGNLIFDGISSTPFKTNAPYAVYADITDQVQSLINPSGTYTVANIRATQGVLSGGSSAGWTLVFIIEDQTKEFKYFTIYDGFVGVTNKPVNINFTGFQALPEGEVTAFIYGSALEGDLNMEGDQLLIKSDITEKFIHLDDTDRQSRNFFNSSITLKNSESLNRMPNSKNTLGYDTFEIGINNPENSVISNNAQEVTLRLLSYTDRYFMFMTAFEIQVSEPDFIAEKPFIPEEEAKPIVDVVTQTEKTIVDNNIKSENVIEPKKDFTNVSVEEEEEEEEEEEKKETKTKLSTKDTSIKYKSNSITGIAAGYYLIANVFSIHSNATNFVEHLKDKSLEADFFINPKNKYRYVFLSYTKDFQEAKRLYSSYKNGSYQEDLWIMSVNMK